MRAIEPRLELPILTICRQCSYHLHGHRRLVQDPQPRRPCLLPRSKLLPRLRCSWARPIQPRRTNFFPAITFYAIVSAIIAEIQFCARWPPIRRTPTLRGYIKHCWACKRRRASFPDGRRISAVNRGFAKDTYTDAASETASSSQPSPCAHLARRSTPFSILSSHTWVSAGESSSCERFFNTFLSAESHCY